MRKALVLAAAVWFALALSAAAQLLTPPFAFVPRAGGGGGGATAYLSAVSTILPVPNGSTAVDATIPNGSSARLTWDSAGAGSCAASGPGFSTGGAVSGTATVSPTTGTNTYSVNCGGQVATAHVTVSGNLIDTAASYCASNGGGNGSSSTPWKDVCIQAAFNAASGGDTVFLAGGNWALTTSVPASSASWAAGQVTFVTSANLGLAVGASFGSSGFTPAGYNGVWTAVAGTTCGGGGCTLVAAEATTLTTPASVLGEVSGSPVAINKQINLIGAGSGNTFDVWGHISNPNGADQCPTSGTSITCVYTTGTSHPYGYSTRLGGSGNPAGFITYGSLTPFSSTCVNEVVAHIFFDGSKSTEGGGVDGLLNFLNCDGPIFLSDIRHLAFNNSSVSPEAQFYFFQTNGSFTVQNSLMGDPLASPGPNYSNAQTAQFNGAYTNGVVMQNDVFYMGGFNPITMSTVSFLGNQQYDYNDGLGGTGLDKPAYGFTGSQPGGEYSVYCPQAGATSSGQCNGDTHAVTANNLFFAPGYFFGTGGGLNDPGTSGGINDLNWTGNWILADDGEIDACEWSGCFASIVGMTINTAVDISCNESYNSPYLFNVTNNSIKTTTRAVFDERGALVTPFTGSISNGSGGAGTTLTAPANTVNVGNIITGTGVTTNTFVTGQSNSTTYTVNNSQMVGGTLSATVAITCKLGNPHPAGQTTQIPISVYGFNGQKNYLSSPSNQYMTNSFTMSPVLTGNFCTPAVGGLGGGCATTGFTTVPTVSFTLGTLWWNGVANVVNFAATNFTAQYGAVQWLASTSSTPPLSSDSRWSSNNPFYSGGNPATLPPSAPNSYVPPTQLSGVSHGDTVYMWVMDSANNISSVASAAIP